MSVDIGESLHTYNGNYSVVSQVEMLWFAWVLVGSLVFVPVHQGL